MGSGKKIVSLTAQNVMKISAVHIEPGGSEVVLIGGKNGAGKSSVLNSIMFALGGASSFAEEPIRRGKKNASVVLDLGDIIVERRFTQSGSTVAVKTKDGAKYGSPQKILDKLFSKLSFDPLAFVNMKPAEQGALLCQLCDLNLQDLDAERASVYSERTVQNRIVKERESEWRQADAKIEAAPAERPDVGELLRSYKQATEAEEAEESRAENLQKLRELLGKLQTANASGKEAFVLRSKGFADSLRERTKIEEQEILNLSTQQSDEFKAMAARHNREREELKEKLNEKVQELEIEFEEEKNVFIDKCEADEKWIGETAVLIREAEAAAKEYVPPVVPSWELQAQIETAEAVAKQFDAWKAVQGLREKFDSAKEVADALTKRIETIDSDRIARIAAVKFPIAGLGFSESGSVTFDGIPFSQASQAQQIRTSVAIGIAMNPDLPILLIRQGSLLDEDGLKLVVEQAEESDSQIWIERVGEGDEGAVIIEDGHVRGFEPPAEEETASESEDVTGEPEAAPGSAGGNEGEETVSNGKPMRSFLTGPVPVEKAGPKRLGGKRKKPAAEESAGE